MQLRIPIYLDFYENSFKRKLNLIHRLQITSRAVLLLTKIKCFWRLKLSITWNNFSLRKIPKIPIYFDFHENLFERKLIAIDTLQINSRGVLRLTKIKRLQRLKLSITWNNFGLKKSPKFPNRKILMHSQTHFHGICTSL